MRHRIVSRAKLGGEEVAYSDESRIGLEDLTSYLFSWMKYMEVEFLGQKGPLASGLYSQ